MRPEVLAASTLRAESELTLMQIDFVSGSAFVLLAESKLKLMRMRLDIGGALVLPAMLAVYVVEPMLT